jgi:hypothetical protein
MIRKTLMITVAAAGLLTAAACSDREDDVVQQPAPGAAAEPVTEQRAEVAQTTAALAFGMTREQLEDADLMSAEMTDLGDVETLVLDAGGQLTHVVIELEGAGDRKVALPIANVSSVARNDGALKDLSTTLTAGELAAMPVWTPQSTAR